MIRNVEYDPTGTVVVRAETYDLDAGTYTREEHGTVVAVRPLTTDEITAYAPPPDPASADVLAAIKAQPTVTKRVDALLAAIEAGTLVL